MIYNIGDRVTVLNSKWGFGQYYKSKGKITKLFDDGGFEVWLDIETINTPKSGWGGGCLSHKMFPNDIIKGVKLND